MGVQQQRSPTWWEREPQPCEVKERHLTATEGTAVCFKLWSESCEGQTPAGNTSVIVEICLIICFNLNKHVPLVLRCNQHLSVCENAVQAPVLQYLYVSPVAVECQGNVFVEYRHRLLLPLAEGSSCAALLGNQAASSRAVELHFLATGHRLIFLSLLPSPLIPHH